MKDLWLRIHNVAGTILLRKKKLKIIEEYLTDILPTPPTKKQIRWCYRDYFFYTLKYLATLDADYFRSGIYRKSGLIRMQSLANRKRMHWRNSVQAPDKWKYFVDKSQFYTAFHKYLGRDYIIIDENTDYNVFADFVKKHNGEVFIKRPVSMGGKDVSHVMLGSDEEIREHFEELIKTKESYIVEERIYQTPEIAEFSPNSVNTMRIVTIIDDDGNVHIANALLRIGNGASVDNFSSGGLAARIDIKAGIIMGPAVDGRCHTYLYHPISGKQIVGFKIPGWQDYLDTAFALASEMKDVRYAGWDILRCDDGRMCCIEGNKDAGLDVQEAPVDFGYGPIYEAMLHNDPDFDYSKIGGFAEKGKD